MKKKTAFPYEGMNGTAIALFKIHTHAEIAYEENPNQVVYLEKDIIKLLIKLGHPAPIWRHDDPANDINK